jgi:hypothetical protein
VDDVIVHRCWWNSGVLRCQIGSEEGLVSVWRVILSVSCRQESEGGRIHDLVSWRADTIMGLTWLVGKGAVSPERVGKRQEWITLRLSLVIVINGYKTVDIF